MTKRSAPRKVPLKPLKVGILGLGVGRAHLEAYRALPEQFSVHAVCDLAERRLNKIDGPKRFTDYAQMLCEPLDIVNVCTPPHLHLAHASAALKAGMHVVCEKPLVTSLAEADVLKRVATRSGKQLMPIFQYRFAPGIARLKAAVDAGLAGKPLVATIETHWLRGADYYAVKWRGRWQSEGGGVWLGHAIHAHDLVRYILGDVQRVYARAATRVNPIETEDCAAVVFEMRNGALVTSSATLGSHDEMSRLRFCFANLTAESCRDPYMPGKNPWTFTPASPGLDQPADNAATGIGYVEQFARFHTALTQDTPLPVTFADGRASLELVSALYHSWETGLAVTLPLKATHPKYRSWIPNL